MTAKQITIKKFVELVGRLGVRMFRRHPNGASFLLPDGAIAAELCDDKGNWEWWLLEV